jgi:hypothetical protein
MLGEFTRFGDGSWVHPSTLRGAGGFAKTPRQLDLWPRLE